MNETAGTPKGGVHHVSLHHLLVNRRFWPLFWTQYLGAFNDNLIKNAAILLISYDTSVTTVLGVPRGGISTLVTSLLIVPALLFAAMAGQLTDRYSKSAMARPIKLFEVALMGIATIGFLFRQYELLMLVVFGLGLQSTFFGPLKYSILPELLTDYELVGGNALVETGTNIAILVGTIVGGILIDEKYVGPHGLAYVSAALLVCAVAGYLSARSITPTPAGSPDLRVDWNPLRSSWEILREVYQTITIFRAILAISWFWLYGFALATLLVPYAEGVLRADTPVLTFLFALFSIGVGVGSILCEKLSMGRLELGLVPIGSIGMSAFAADLFFAWKPEMAPSDHLLGISEFLHHAGGLRVTADLLLIAMFIGFYIVPLYTFIQARAKPDVRSRVVAANNIMNSLFMTAWAGIQISLLHYMTVIQILLLLSVLNFIVASYIYTVLPEFVLRFYCYILVYIMYRVRSSGVENVPQNGPAVLVCNHITYIDWLVINGVVPRPIRFVMTKAFMNIPVLKILMKQAHVIPIASSKEDPAMLERAFDKIAAELEAGELVCIFPEGHLTADGHIDEFRRGIERIIERTPVPVVPMALQGLWGSWFSRYGGKPGVRRPHRRFWSSLGLVIGEPVPASDVTAAGLQTLVAALRGDQE